MTYKEYTAQIEYRDEDGCFVGHLAGISDIVGFHGRTITELRSAFEEAVDDYLETCQKLNRLPQTSSASEEMAWSNLTAQQFLAGYSEADAIYDELEVLRLSENERREKLSD